MPLGIWALVKEGYKNALTPQNLVVAPLLLLPLILYGIQGSQGVPFMLGWEFNTFTFSSFVIFCVIEFLLVLAILYYAMPKQRFLIATLAVFLTLLSLIIRDVTFNNLLMRASMPAICIMAALAFRALLENKSWCREALIVYLFIGAFPVAAAFAKGISPSTETVDKAMTFEKLTSIYTYEEHSYMTDFYLVKTESVQKFFDVPLMRDLPPKRKDRN